MNREKREKLLEELGVTKEFAKEAWKAYSGSAESWKEADKKSLKAAIMDLKEKNEKRRVVFIQNPEPIEINTAGPIKIGETEDPIFYAQTLPFQEKILYMMENGLKIDSSDLREIPWSFHEEDTEVGENRRWSRSVTSYLSYEKDGEKKYLALDWEEGLTEMQENEFYNQPRFVIPRQVTKTITVTEWDPVTEKEPEEAEAEEEEENER